MSSRTAVLSSLDVEKSIKLHDRKRVFWDTGKETVVSVEETKEMELFLASELVLIRRKRVHWLN